MVDNSNSKNNINPTGSSKDPASVESRVDWLEILNQSKKILSDIHRQHSHFLNEKGITPESLETTLKETLEKSRTNYEKSAHAVPINTYQSNEKMLVLQATIRYWKQEATEHKMWAGFLIIGVVATFFFTTAWIYQNRAALMGAVGQNAQLGTLGILFLIALISIWVIRSFSRLVLIQFRLKRDAQERISLVSTYLALQKEEKGYARDLIMDCIYTPIISYCVGGVTDFFYNDSPRFQS